MQDNDQTSELGVAIAKKCVLNTGFIFRTQRESDFGIDAHFELKDAGKATGRLIAAQIKSGPSYFREESKSGFLYRPTDTHRKLWINHSLPVVVVLCNTKTETCYYELVTSETCVAVNKNFKILVPRTQTIDASNRLDLIDIASPVAATTDYSIASEKDQSYVNTKRIGLNIVLHPINKALNRPIIGAVIRNALKYGKESNYARSKISSQMFDDKPVDVVSGFVYLRDVDLDSSAWLCRFEWVSSEFEGILRPSIFKGEPCGDGLIIDWNGRTEISKIMDDRRITKSVYLTRVDVFLDRLKTIRREITRLNMFGECHSNTHIFSKLTKDFEAHWDNSTSAPLECQRLDQVIQEILATVGNLGLIWNQCNIRERKQKKVMLNREMTNLQRLNEKISHLREEVR